MRKTFLVAAGFVALRENGDNDGCGYYYDGKDDNFFINLGLAYITSWNLHLLQAENFSIGW